jgi:diaminopimelate epimerase
MGNPHAVAFVDDLATAGRLCDEPSYDPALYPHGVNVEFVVRRGAGTSRCGCTSAGSGETRRAAPARVRAAVAAAPPTAALPRRRTGGTLGS